MLGTWWIPSRYLSTSYYIFILVDVQPLGRLRIFVRFPFLYFTYVPGLSVPSALLRILGVGVIDLFPFAVPVCLMASFIISSLQGVWGSPDSPLYLFSTFVTICNFSLCHHWVIRASEGEAVCLIDSSINLGLSEPDSYAGFCSRDSWNHLHVVASLDNGNILLELRGLLIKHK